MVFTETKMKAQEWKKLQLIGRYVKKIMNDAAQQVQEVDRC
jgi:hypothetical protein